MGCGYSHLLIPALRRQAERWFWHSWPWPVKNPVTVVVNYCLPTSTLILSVTASFPLTMNLEDRDQEGQCLALPDTSKNSIIRTVLSDQVLATHAFNPTRETGKWISEFKTRLVLREFPEQPGLHSQFLSQNKTWLFWSASRQIIVILWKKTRGGQ